MPDSMHKRPTAEDVAKLAGVSTATVSHVVNDTRYVSEKTRASVMAAIQQLNYRPSALARGLASNKTSLVGVVLSDINNPLFRDVYKSIETELFTAGYDLILANTGESIRMQNSILEALLSRQVDGLIIAPNFDSSDQIGALRDLDIPVVAIDRGFDDSEFPLITVNNEEITYTAISHLIEDGHQHIAFVGGLMEGIEGVSTVSQRLTGYRRALRDYGLQVSEHLIYVDGKAVQADGYSAAMRMLTGSKPPTAIFTTNSLLLLGVFRALQELSLKCPDDVGVVSFDHDHWMDILSPPVTVIEQPTQQLGTLAAQWLMRLMTGEEDLKGTQEIIACRFLVRGSCSVKCMHEYQNRALR